MIRKRKPHEQHRDGGLSETAPGGEVRSGLLAPRASWRGAVVASAGSEWSDAAAAVAPVVDEGEDSAGRGRPRGYGAGLMRRTFEIDVLTYPQIRRGVAAASPPEKGCPRGASLLSPDGHFPLVFQPI